MERRQFVALTATTGALSVAGCLGGGGDGESGEDSPEAAAEVYFEAASADEKESVLHPESPLTPREAQEQQGANTDVEASILAEDTDAAGVEEAGYSPDRMDHSELDSLAEVEEVTLVEATVEINGEQLPFAAVTATDGGDWYVLTTATEAHTQ